MVYRHKPIITVDIITAGQQKKAIEKSESRLLHHLKAKDISNLSFPGMKK